MENFIYQKILEGDLRDISYFVSNKSVIIRIAQKDEDLRIYMCIAYMIQYCKQHKKEEVSDLSHYAAIYLYTRLNYINGAYELSYQHMRDAIEYDVENYEIKEYFLRLYFDHPHISVDYKYCLEIAKEIIEVLPNSDIANEVIKASVDA